MGRRQRPVRKHPWAPNPVERNKKQVISCYNQPTMPELPEVETIARALREGGRGAHPITGSHITDAEVLWSRTVAAPDPATFVHTIRGSRIATVERRGKYLHFRLEKAGLPQHLVVHLRMSGDLLVLTPGAPPPRHPRLRWHLSDGRRLVFNDPRKFGRVWLLDDPAPLFTPLGPEPFDPHLTPARFYARLQRRRTRLKPLLLDQTFLAGVGNIYADEALHVARLHPLTPAHTLDLEQATRLLIALRTVLREGIARNGTSIDWMYQGGDYQRHLRVYGRTGQPCPTCGTPIVRLRIAQRSTHYCPQCQPLPEGSP